MMFFVTEDQSRILQELNDRMGLRVYHVGPFVDFICEDGQNDAENDCPFIQLS